MKRIESCPSIVDSVSFFDNDANIADSFHADLAPLPARPHGTGLHLHSGALPSVPLALSKTTQSLTCLLCGTVPEHNEFGGDAGRAMSQQVAQPVAQEATSSRAGTGRKDTKALTAEERKQRRCAYWRLCAPSEPTPTDTLSCDAQAREQPAGGEARLLPAVG